MQAWDLRGRTALVTGATGGIGWETALGLAQSGARVFVHGRTLAKAEDAAARIRKREPDTVLLPVAGDFARLSDVRALADAVQAKTQRLHLLVNNAGAWVGERRITDDGFELLWQSNHLAPFLLTGLLRPLLEASAPARVINIASNAHFNGRIDFNDLDVKNGRYDGFAVYCRTKLANVLFSNALARRLATTGVTSNALHPGVVNTGIASSATRGLAVLFRLMKPFYISPRKGAETSLWLARAPEAAQFSGGYFEKRRAIEPLAAARDEALQDRLWGVSAVQAGL
jgi:NAD(P)-dependent dehydrogenase (short-subunit alcohol dehydrogenase family)